MIWIFGNFPCPFLRLTVYGSKSLHLATVELCTSSSQKADRESRAGILEQSVRTRDPARMGCRTSLPGINRLAGRYCNSIPAGSLASQTVLKFRQPNVLKHSPTVHRTKYRQSQSTYCNSVWLSVSMSVPYYLLYSMVLTVLTGKKATVQKEVQRREDRVIANISVYF